MGVKGSNPMSASYRFFFKESLATRKMSFSMSIRSSYSTPASASPDFSVASVSTSSTVFVACSSETVMESSWFDGRTNDVSFVMRKRSLGFGGEVIISREGASVSVASWLETAAAASTRDRGLCLVVIDSGISWAPGVSSSDRCFVVDAVTTGPCSRGAGETCLAGFSSVPFPFFSRFRSIKAMNDATWVDSIWLGIFHLVEKCRDIFLGYNLELVENPFFRVFVISHISHGKKVHGIDVILVQRHVVIDDVQLFEFRVKYELFSHVLDFCIRHPHFLQLDQALSHARGEHAETPL